MLHLLRFTLDMTFQQRRIQVTPFPASSFHIQKILWGRCLIWKQRNSPSWCFVTYQRPKHIDSEESLALLTALCPTTTFRTKGICLKFHLLQVLIPVCHCRKLKRCTRTLGQRPNFSWEVANWPSKSKLWESSLAVHENQNTAHKLTSLNCEAAVHTAGCNCRLMLVGSPPPPIFSFL